MVFIPPGQYAQVREAGVEPLRQTILDLEPDSPNISNI